MSRGILRDLLSSNVRWLLFHGAGHVPVNRTMRPVTADEVLARSLADWSAYWDKLGPLSAAQVRWREAEREFRAERAAVGFLPDADNPHVAKFPAARRNGSCGKAGGTCAATR